MSMELLRARAELAVRSTNHLAEFVLVAPSGKAIRQADIHRAIQAHIDYCLDHGIHAAVVAPFGHGKTEQVAILRPLQAIGRNPNVRIKLVCSVDDQATARVSAIQQYILQSSAYHLTFPRIVPDSKHWSGHSFRVVRDILSKDATIEAHGVFSTKGLGARADLMLFDDVVDLSDVWAPSTRQKKVQAFGTQWMQRLVPGGKAIYIATAWHENDLTHQLLRNPQWSVLWMAVSQDLTAIDCTLHSAPADHPLRTLGDRSDDTPHHFTIPGWFTQAELASRRAADPRAFDRGYRNLAISDGELWFPSFGAIVKVGDPRDYVGADWLRYTGVDLSAPRRPGNVIFTIAVHPESKHRIPIDIRRGHWSSPQVAEQICHVVRAFGPQKVLVENNGYQDAILDWMRSSGQNVVVPLESFTTGANKHADETGVRSLEAEFSARSWTWYRPHEDPQCGCAWCATYEEFRQAPLGQSNDGVMAAWFAREAARQGDVQRPGIITESIQVHYEDLLTAGCHYEDPFVPEVRGLPDWAAPPRRTGGPA